MLKKIRRLFYRWLRWGEKYTKTDMMYLTKGGFWLNLATVFNTAILLVLLYAFGNFVTPEVYGEYRYFFSLYGLLVIASLSGFNSVVSRAVAQGKEGELIRCFKIQLKSSLLGSLASFGIALYYHLNGNPTLAIGFVIMGLALPLMESLDLYAAFLNGKKLFRQTAVASIAGQAFTTVALLVAIYYHERVLLLLTTYFVSWILIKVFFFVRVRKQYVQNATLAEKTPSIGLNFSAVGLLNQIAGQLDRIALFHYIGAREVALYSFAIAPVEHIKGLFKNANALIFPKFSVRTEAELRAGILHKMIIFGASALVAATLYAVTAPFIIGWFLPQYIEIIPLSQIFAFSLVGVMTIPISVAINAIPKIKALYLSNLISPTINILLIVLLIPAYGFPGAIAAKAIGRIINIFVTYVIFIRS